MFVRPMEFPRDLDEVCKIEDSTFKEGRYPKDQIEYEYHNELSKSYVCVENNKVIGFLFFMITFNSATIVQVAVDPKYQHKGVATMLFNEMFKHFTSLGYGVIETVTLELREQNKIAYDFYTKMGFKTIVIKKKYYTNGDNAIYMGKTLL